MSRNEDPYHALLMEYASGCLDEAHALVVATHMALSPSARKHVADYEKIGGAMLNDCCKPVAMKSDALKCVMAKLDVCGPAPAQKGPCADKKKPDMTNYHEVPGCLESYMETTTWTRSAGGMETIHIKTSCSGSRAELMKSAPGAAFESRKKSPPQITLVLRGGFADNGTVYKRGDIIINDGGNAYRYVSDSGEGCVYFVVRKSGSPLRRFLSMLCGN